MTRTLTPLQTQEILDVRANPVPTLRPTSPGAEEVLHTPIMLLDHGMLRFVDYMGTDASIPQAARVSYGKGTKAVTDDTALIRYLMRHHHSTPFEMVTAKFHVVCPIFVARQWLRHRSGCIAGNVTVDFDLPGGIKRKGNQKHTLTMKQIFEKFQPTKNIARPDRQENPFFKKERIQKMNLRSCDEDQKTPNFTSVVDIWECGVKPIISVHFPDRKNLRATKDHRCFTDKGWMTLEEALTQNASFATYSREKGYVSTPVSVDEGNEVWKSIPNWEMYEASSQGRIRGKRGIKKPTVGNHGYQVVSLSTKGKSYVFTVHSLVLSAFGKITTEDGCTRHLDNNRQNNILENLAWGTYKENGEDRTQTGVSQRNVISWVKPIKWQHEPPEMTYDMEVKGPYHNFVAGGVIVHNSFNEYSARYSILEREFYVPEPGMLAAQSVTNKQGRGQVLEGEDAARVLDILKGDATRAYDHYEWMADEDGAGLARELARINLPVSVYTQFYWSVNLWNLMHFTKLRADGHAQYEIRVYAQAILDQILTPWVPAATQAFLDYRVGATSLSRQATALVQAALKGDGLEGLERPSKREMDELLAQFPGLARFL